MPDRYVQATPVSLSSCANGPASADTVEASLFDEVDDDFWLLHAPTSNIVAATESALERNIEGHRPGRGFIDHPRFGHAHEMRVAVDEVR